MIKWKKQEANLQTQTTIKLGKNRKILRNKEFLHQILTLQVQIKVIKFKAKKITK